MAVVDSLLKLIESQGAEALVFAPGQPPALEKGGEPRALSMPDPGPEFLEAIVDETLSEAEREVLRGGAPVQSTYEAGGTVYYVRVDARADGPRLAFRRSPPDDDSKATATVTTPASPSPAPAPASSPAAAAPSLVPVTPTPAIGTAPAPTVPTLAAISGPPLSPGPLAPVLQRAAHELASDILISSGRVVRLRVGGHIVEASPTRLDDEAILKFVGPVLGPSQHDELSRTGSVDLALQVTTAGAPMRFRGNLFRQHGGLGLALRPIRRDPPTLHRLNLPPELMTLAYPRSGLVLVTGTAGSGKSTTLVALIEHLNQTSTKHIITLEDPIEYEYELRGCLIHQRQIGIHVDAFSTGLRAALRESPDVILVGEMRDHATISAALTAAETGHLVLSTLHTAGAAMAVDRIIDVFPQYQQAQVRFQLSAVLRAVLTQRLLPSDRSGGLLPMVELLRVNTAVAAKIRDGRGHQLQSEIQKGRGEGMISFEASLAEHVRAGRLGRDAALEHADDPSIFRQHLSG